jgi:hypothetical protein
MSATTNPDYAQVAADIGLTSLRTLYPALTGNGVTVGQVEASGTGSNSPTANDFEVEPGQIGHPVDNSDGFLTYFNGLASTAVYNDGTIGTYSAHATEQASFFYGDALYEGEPTGVAPDVTHVDNYFANNFTIDLLAPSFPDKVVNMSFLYDPPANFDTSYDAAANADNIVLVASAGNGGSPASPSSAYNVISVDSSISVEAIGPAPDGVPKPDISAPQLQTSRTAAIVSGCATLLVQAGTAGWAGATAQNEADAVDFRTVKALLLNGAVKPSDYYSNAYAPTASQPLSAIYGSGDVNILNSVQELYGGEIAAGATTSVALGGTATVPAGIATVTTSEGWNLGSLTARSGHDAIDCYAFDIAAGQGLIATLTWAANNSNAIDFLELDLVDAATGAMLASSAATASNVQQVSFKAAAATDTVLEVRLHGAASVELTDKYALAFAPLDTVACFCAGARILTERGEVPVERLVPGDGVITAGGRAAPVRFVGHSRAGAASEPVRILAHAVGEGLPHRDLLLSPEHAVAITDAEGLALVPIHRLVNGATIASVPGAGPLSYYHVELDRHDVILAEGLPVESYLDTGNRHAFDNTGVVRALHPCFGPGNTETALRIWAERACAPLLLHGPRLGACHARLLARAEAAFACTPDPRLRAIAHGREIAPRRCGPGHAHFLLPAGCDIVRLASRAIFPRHRDPDAADARRLGVPLTALRHAGREVALDTPLLSGSHALETDGTRTWRWTDGAAEFLPVPAPDACWLEVWWMHGWARYWTTFIRSGALCASGAHV